MRRVLTRIVVLALVSGGCARPRQFELRGQVLAVDRTRQEITIRHDDIRGFMPGMTMPFKVRDARLLDGRTVGDLVTATLVVEKTDVFLSKVERTGHAPVTEPPPAAARMDLVAPGDRAPDVQLTDETGATRALSEWRGRALAVTFTYTRCPLPDFCPRMDRQFAAVQREIQADERLRDRVSLLSISVDPAFDTPEVLAGHGRRSGADPHVWRFMTGDREAIARVRVAVRRIDHDRRGGRHQHHAQPADRRRRRRREHRAHLRRKRLDAGRALDALRRASA